MLSEPCALHQQPSDTWPFIVPNRAKPCRPAWWNKCYTCWSAWGIFPVLVFSAVLPACDAAAAAEGIALAAVLLSLPCCPPLSGPEAVKFGASASSLLGACALSLLPCCLLPCCCSAAVRECSGLRRACACAPSFTAALRSSSISLFSEASGCKAFAAACRGSCAVALLPLTSVTFCTAQTNQVGPIGMSTSLNYHCAAEARGRHMTYEQLGESSSPEWR